MILSRALVIERVFYLAPNGNTYPFFSQNLVTHFPINLTPDAFTTGPSDYDMASDRIYCPCGKEIEWGSGTVGDAWRLVRAELREHGK